MKLFAAAGAALAAAVLLLLSLAASRGMDPALDEIAHAGAAYRLVLDGHDRLNPEHPPLVKWLAGAAMHACCATPDRDAHSLAATEQWQAGRELLFGAGAPDVKLVAAARAPSLLLALFGALGVWAWTRRLFGGGIAAACTLLYAASPTVTAQSALLLTDLPVGVFALWSMACAWFALRAESRWALAAAMAAGAFAVLACLAKFSGALVLPILLAVLALGVHGEQRIRRASRLVLAALVPFALALVALGRDGIASWLEGLFAVGHNHLAGYAWYALGEFSLQRRDWYFPLAFALKSTPVELVLLGGALLAAWRAQPRSDALVVAVFPVAYFAAMVLLAPETGQRYLAPVYPFLFVAAGFGLVALRTRARIFAAAGLVAVQLAAGVLARDNPLGYFNGIAGCRGAAAYTCLDDSNLDWGQRIGRVRDVVVPRLRPGEPVLIDYAGAAPLRAYLPAFRVLETQDWRAPQPGLYVVSAHMLVRRAAYMPDLEDTPLFAALHTDSALDAPYFVADLREGADSPAR